MTLYAIQQTLVTRLRQDDCQSVLGYIARLPQNQTNRNQTKYRARCLCYYSTHWQA